jgi:hypothetical protein
MNTLKTVVELACNRCKDPIRENGKHKYGGTRYVHEGEPCRNYYGKNPNEHPGFPVTTPDPLLRCKDCWTPGTDNGQVIHKAEAWGDSATCATCGNRNFYSIGD